MKNKLETYEWDNTWIEKSEDTSLARCLYIGDSISCGTRTFLNGTVSKGEILFDGFGTSKALDNPYFFRSLSIFAEQEPKKRDIVIFNNGLHGWHISEDDYFILYGNFLDLLIKEFTQTPICPVLSTYVTNADYHNDRVKRRNELALKAARERQLEVIDLYTVSESNKELLLNDGVHFSDAGYIALAQAVMNFLKKRIEIVKE